MPDNLQNEAGNNPASGDEAAKIAVDKAAADAAASAKAAEESAAADKAAADAKAAEDKAKAEGAPEKYDDFKVPEGIVADAGVFDQVKAVAKELNLSQAKAQTLVDKLAPAVAKSQVDRFNAEVDRVRSEWAAASKSDKEVGGEAFDKNRGAASEVLKTFGTEALTKLLDESGLAQHPEVLRLLVRVRAAVSEDKFSTANQRPAGDKAAGVFKYASAK
jgi:hypothetical protein